MTSVLKKKQKKKKKKKKKMVKKKELITDLMKLMKKWKTSDFDDFNHVKKE